MGCGCGGKNTKVAPTGARGLNNNMVQEQRYAAFPSKEQLEQLVANNPDKFVKVIYNNGISQKYAFSYARALLEFGFSYYTNKFSGEKEIWMHVDDAKVAPSKIVTIIADRGIVADTLKKAGAAVTTIADKVEKVEDKIEDAVTETVENIKAAVLAVKQDVVSKLASANSIEDVETIASEIAELVKDESGELAQALQSELDEVLNEAKQQFSEIEEVVEEVQNDTFQLVDDVTEVVKPKSKRRTKKKVATTEEE